MKLIIAGSAGLAPKILNQAISNPVITSIVGITSLSSWPSSSMPPISKAASKFKSVTCDLTVEDFENYPEHVKQELSGADACIWLIAVTPPQLDKVTFERARKICLDYTMSGLSTISSLAGSSRAKPFRFIYLSGILAERDQTKKPRIMPEYSLMRGECETRILEYAQKSGGLVEAVIAKPGFVYNPDKQGRLERMVNTVLYRTILGVPKVGQSELAAILLHQAVNGIEKDTLLNQDFGDIGRRAAGSQS